MVEIERFDIKGQLPTGGLFSHVTKAGPHVWLSGVIGMRQDGSIPENVADQLKVAFENLDVCLETAGARKEHIVRTTLFMTDVSDRPRLADVRRAYYGSHIPTSTLAGVKELVFPEVKLELEVEAFITG